MVDSQDRAKRLEEAFTALRILPIAFVMGVGLFAVIATALVQGREAGPLSPAWIALFGLSGLLVVTGLVLGRRPVARGHDVSGEPGSAEEAIGAYQAAKITGWAVSEAGGLLAALLILVTGAWAIGLPIAVAAVLALVLSLARREELDRLAGIPGP